MTKKKTSILVTDNINNLSKEQFISYMFDTDPMKKYHIYSTEEINTLKKGIEYYGNSTDPVFIHTKNILTEDLNRGYCEVFTNGPNY